MNRRTFLATVGSITTGMTAATAGCMSSNASTPDAGDGPETTEESSGPDVTVDITTSDDFDELATHTEPTVEVKTDETDEGETRKSVVAKYVIEPDNEECADVTAAVTAYDSEDIVLHEFDSRDQFDPGKKYRVTHTIPRPPEEVSRIGVELTINSLSGMCYV